MAPTFSSTVHLSSYLNAYKEYELLQKQNSNSVYIGVISALTKSEFLSDQWKQIFWHQIKENQYS